MRDENPVMTFPQSRKESILRCLLMKGSLKIRAKVKGAKC